MQRTNTYNAGMNITLSELEDAINFWRAQAPATGEERALSAEVDALANQYALMIYHHQRTAVLDAALEPLFAVWRAHVIKA